VTQEEEQVRLDCAIRAYLVDVVTPPRGTVCRSDRLPVDPDFDKPVQNP
jgi:hypothetical protein